MVTVKQFNSLSECIKLAQNKETDSETLKLICKLYSLNELGWSGILERSLAENPNTPSEIREELIKELATYYSEVELTFHENNK